MQENSAPASVGDAAAAGEAAAGGDEAYPTMPVLGTPQDLSRHPVPPRRRRDLLRAVLFAFLPAVGLLGVVSAMARRYQFESHHLLRDPAAITGDPNYLGAVSNAGVVLWAGAGILCLFTAAQLPRTGRRGTGARAFLLASGLLSLLLAADDLFMIHEEFDKLGYGMRWFVISLYVPLGVAYLLRFGRFIIERTDWRVFGFAVFWLGISFVVDIAIPPLELPPALVGEPHLMLEEGAKLIGIALWFAYFVSACSELLGVQRSGAHRRPRGHTAPS